MSVPVDTDKSVRPHRRRGRRDWVVDVFLFLFALLMWAETVLVYTVMPMFDVPGGISQPFLRIDAILGLVACVSLWWRRRYPMGVMLVAGLIAAVAVTAVGALAVALVGAAIYRPWQSWAPTLAIITVAALPWLVLVPNTRLDTALSLLFAMLLMAACVGWGTAIRSRRMLVERLREDVRRIAEERERRLADARVEERRRIAREMHDVVAHRMSLLSVHAGALAYRTERAESGQATPLDPAELGAAVRIIRDNAHRALDELGGILEVLRSTDTHPEEDHAGTAAPQPGLLDVGRLVDEAADVGQRVEYVREFDEEATLDGAVERTVYRVVQEGLTNARKHAPGARVRVRVVGSPGPGLEVSVTNALPVGVAPTEIPGVGAGLTGLAERVELDGGTLEHGPGDGRFVLSARLPWPTPQRRSEGRTEEVP